MLPLCLVDGLLRMWCWPKRLCITSANQGRKEVMLGLNLTFIRPMIVWNENSFAGFLKLLGLTPSSLI